MTRALLLVFDCVLAYMDPDYVAACNKDKSKCRQTNYKNDFDIPVGYSKQHSPGDIVQLEIGIFYHELLYVDTAKGAFGLIFYLNLRWTDPRLTWSSDGLEVTSVDSSLIWTPKLRNWFAKDSNSFFEGQGRNVKLFNNGTLYWILASETRSSCKIHTRSFPYDKHKCSVAFAGEHATNYFFRPLFSSVVISAYTQQNTDWKLLQSKQWVTYKNYLKLT